MSQRDLDEQQEKARRDGRLAPEEVLDRYHLHDREMGVSPGAGTETPQIQEHQQGRLRIYLGAAAGVGKTYAMLNEGRRRKARGTDVIVGYVETHGRAQTQVQIGDLEVIPRKRFIYRNLALEEMDTPALLARHPQVALVDELAHTNAPGSRHPKRYQDVQDLLGAGIDVVTTVNVQHLESLNDLVANITGIEVRETLPDRILDEAEEVELIDIAPHALQQRIQQGEIYPAERIETALAHFFREGNLMALRELALRQTAQKTEEQLEAYMTDHAIHKTWATTERVLVGFDHHPQSRQVIRHAWRLAHGLDGDLLAIHIEPEGAAAWKRAVMTFLKDGANAGKNRIEAQKRLEEHARLAEDLGAEVIRISSDDLAGALIEVARQRHVTQLVLGQPARSPWEERLWGSVVNRMLHLSDGTDIHLVLQNRERAAPGREDAFPA
ncbi:sensor protein KdpD [Ktedonobacter racemifer]|uniref:Osmosensitive K channel His kinase sensor n=1 Tax=Ktedonobacter racemifer DSM 44963 TaxID=485913 RepID=D6U2K0_KTERA|nr:universal stress protein [Ktedonobacter racemifer]EFH80964.1 Osmosensitive K channel His kinase sensor [Ktedonobacter racemifer DSM 44963]